ncbi:MAG: potassium channel family protein [Gemmataceae bacterium]|nr:potassium channel family protein [Gemmataceae bacterium]
MAWLGVTVAALLILVVMIDTFEVMILPRRVRHDFRLARLFYRAAWVLWRAMARLLPAGRWRFGFLSVFGPMSLFALMTVWATGLIVGFALLHWSLDTAMSFPRHADDSFASYLYFSGTTFFTLGYGDLVPIGRFGQTLSVAEAGIGFGFLAVVISYLPVLYQAFSRREITISLLDARAGSPPTAGELLRRLVEGGSLAGVDPLLTEWERWAAELLESHLSYPVLRFYRSQHDNQSWVGALTTILDTSALLVAGLDGAHGHQARLTFAMARHAAVDLGLVSRTPPLPLESDRLPAADFDRLRDSLRSAGVPVREGHGVAKALSELRGLYEPFVNALAAQFQFAIPPFMPDKPPVDNWQTSPWTPRSPGLDGLPAAGAEDDHIV